MEMCECFVDLINGHNEQLNTMSGLAELLIETFPNVELTDVNEVFCEAMNGLIEQSVQLCAMANCAGNEEWFMDDKGYVFTECVDHEYCCNCDTKISDYLN